ncbi:hypothetical protein [Leucothrix arctica]|uniref:Uncharacterized protein n=1 Tax=Leucothrix arctica TaxID=1481894 RepID=A0A317CSY6_9GAMM|nr:hypothetical protein [Leucothrix arctica]PWQ99550.1 hypothetical protein DKT75_00325 [Leucothrix arctica]
MVGDSNETPNLVKEHNYFESALSNYPFGFQYRDFPKESYISQAWIEKDTLGEVTRHAINLYIPNQKLESIYEDCLPFLSWLASVSATSGYVGSYRNESIDDFAPVLLFIYQGELYMGDSEKAQSFSTGKLLPSGSA